MPDDYQNQGQPTGDKGMDDLLSSLGVTLDGEPSADGANQNAQQQGKGEEPSTPETPPADDGKGGEGAQPQEPDADAHADEQRRNKAFAEMRTALGSYEKVLNQMQKTMGFNGTREDFLKHLSDITYAQEAKQRGQGMDPSILKRLDELENKNKTLEEQNSRTLFASNLKNLQTTFNLSNKEITDFVNFAAQEHIDLTIPGTNFVTLYRGLNYDTLVKKEIEAARQEWLGQQAKGQSQASAPDGKSGKKDPSPTDVNTMAEFNSLLQNLPK